MSILIKGMEMPKSCFYCPFREKVNPDDYVCMALNKEFEETFSLIAVKRHKDCPLVPVPPHGRLADLDKIENEIALLSPEGYTTGGIRLILDYAPTIIPASEEED